MAYFSGFERQNPSEPEYFEYQKVDTRQYKFYLMSRTVEKIEQQLDNEMKIMEVHKINGKYDDAEKSRLKIEALQKEHSERVLAEMHQRHKKEYNDLVASNDNSEAAFNKYWDDTENRINSDLKRHESEMIERHKKEIDQTKAELDIQLSPKVKESSQLLNLRKMEEHMVKQKIFAEAHKVQQQIFEMERVEKKAWLDKRNQRIETALATLRNKQGIELSNLRQKYKNILDESIRDRKIEEERLHQKFQNLHKDLKNQQDKEVLNYKGQFRTRGGRDSPQRTRSTFQS